MEIDVQILPYLLENASEALAIADFTDAKISKLTGGDYNFNYHVVVANQDLLVRVNIEPQSGSDTQIEYEHGTLKFLEPRGVTPKVFYLDNTRKYLPYGLLIEEFIPGTHLQFSPASMRRVATAMARLHTTSTKGAPLRRRDNPIKEQVNAVNADLARYRQRQNPHGRLLELAEAVIARLTKQMPQLEDLYRPTSIIHTDPNPANIIDNGQKVFFIDWEQGRIDDPSYDIAAFFSDVLNMWASPRILTTEEKQTFLDTYVAITGDESIADRLKPRQLAYTLNAVLWAANRIADVDEGKIDANLGAQNYDRYRVMAAPVELEKVLAT